MKLAGPVLTLIGLAAAAPSKTINRRADSCGQYDSVQTGVYTVSNNLWGQDSATSGSGCIAVQGLDGNKLAWSTSWSWEGPENRVKGYPNVVMSTDAQKLSEVKSITTTWAWSYDGADLVSNVAYDLFTSSAADGEREFEIMVWLDKRGGIGPLSLTEDANKVATPLTPSVNLAGREWNLFKGPNGPMTVYSFVGADSIPNFSGDLKTFVDYLVAEQGFDENQFLTSTGAGTEAFTGKDAVFTVSEFSIEMA